MPGGTSTSVLMEMAYSYMGTCIHVLVVIIQTLKGMKGRNKQQPQVKPGRFDIDRQILSHHMPLLIAFVRTDNGCQGGRKTG